MAGTFFPQRTPRRPAAGSHRWLRRALNVALSAVLVAGATAAVAAPMPNGGRLISVTAREQPLNAFLQDLFASMDVLASVSPNLSGSVNGTFSGPAAKVLRDVARVYNLITYYDGSVMHVGSAGELARRTFAVNPALSERMMREVADLDLTDSRNTLRRSGEGNMVAVGAKRFVEQVEELVRAAQAQSAPANQPPAAADFRVFYLRYAWAHDVTMTIGGRQMVVPGVASIVRSLVDSRVNKPLGRETLMRPTQPSLRGQGLASQGVSDRKPSADDVRGEQVDRLVNALARTAQPGDPADGQGQQAESIRPEVNQVRIQADQRLNAVIVRDSADRMPRYEQLIAALDVEPQSLEIEATIIDVNVERATELGINWRWNNDGREASFGGSVPTTGLGGAASVVLGSVGQFISRIRALQSEGAARVVSSPQVVTLSNVEALFDNSQTFYVRVAGRQEVDLFNVSAGTQLRVTPHVFRDNRETRIKLLVNVEDGNITNRQVDQIPVVERSTVNTQALIAEGESLLIGGMIREVTTSGTDKVPGLGDVPIVGNAFKSRQSGSTRVERMFLITPRLASTRTAAAQSTLGAVRAGATPTGPAAPEPAPRGAQPAVPAPAAPGSYPVQGPAGQPASPAPGMATAPAAAPMPAPTSPVTAGAAPAGAAPAGAAPAPRRSVVVDLDALPATTRSIAAALRDDPANGRVLKSD